VQGGVGVEPWRLGRAFELYEVFSTSVSRSPFGCWCSSERPFSELNFANRICRSKAKRWRESCESRWEPGLSGIGHVRWSARPWRPARPTPNRRLSLKRWRPLGGSSPSVSKSGNCLEARLDREAGAGNSSQDADPRCLPQLNQPPVLPVLRNPVAPASGFPRAPWLRLNASRSLSLCFGA
jgi:hypothetical protein